MLHIVTGEVTINRYMIDYPEYEKFTHLIEAADEAEARTIIVLLYKLKNDPYAVSYSPSIHEIASPISMATIQEMQNAK